MRWLGWLFGFAIAFAVHLNAADASTKELRGRLIPAKNGEPLKFKTESGNVYTLLRTHQSVALFLDTNLQSKTLLLKGRVWLGTETFEVTGNLHSIRDGKTNELFYYCNICAIKGIEPGPCMCCREPVELVEEPVGSKSDH